MSVLQYFPQTSNMSYLFDQSVLCTLLILNNSHAMRNISLCHMNAIHIVVIVCYCSVGAIAQTPHATSRNFTTAMSGSSLVTENESRGKSSS